MKAIVLAGGLGTRLSAISQGKPKPLMEIAGHPFLSYIFNYLISQGITEVVLAVSYRWEMIHTFYGNHYKTLSLQYSIEDKPLGTGGAIIKTIHDFSFPEELFILNGDTFFEVNLSELQKFHHLSHSDLTLALCHQEDPGRFGKVELDSQFKIKKFLEKKSKEAGWINGGIYLINKNLLANIQEDTVFSLEKDFFPTLLSTHKVFGFRSSGYFIDIGIPEDYKKALSHFSPR